MSSSELDNKLYEQITDYLTPVPLTDEPKVGGIIGVKIHIAERLVLKFPPLGLKENKWALLLAVELKLKELREIILQDESTRKKTEFVGSLSESRSHSLLSELGVISGSTRARHVSVPDMDDVIPF